MNLYIRYFGKQYSKYIVISAVIICRLMQSIMYSRGDFSEYVSSYITFFDLPFLSLVLPLMYCIWIFGSSPLAADNTNIMFRAGSRLRVLLMQGSFILADALTFMVLLNITALPLVFSWCPSAAGHLDYIFASMLLQLLFCVICSLLSSAIYILFSKSYLSFIAVVAYGAADFLIAYVNIIKDKTWFCGTGRIKISDSKVAYVNVPLFISFIIVLTLINAVILSKKDYISKTEVKSLTDENIPLKSALRVLSHLFQFIM